MLFVEISSINPYILSKSNDYFAESKKKKKILLNFPDFC